MKKLISLFLALSMAIVMLVVPASAAGLDADSVEANEVEMTEPAQEPAVIFGDCDPTVAKAVNYLASVGVIAPAEAFRPDALISAGEMSVMLTRFILGDITVTGTGSEGLTAYTTALAEAGIITHNERVMLAMGYAHWDILFRVLLAYEGMAPTADEVTGVPTQSPAYWNARRTATELGIAPDSFVLHPTRGEVALVLYKMSDFVV